MATSMSDFIIEIEEVKKYPDNFRKISINWENMNWDNAPPVIIGAVESNDKVFSFDSLLINDPITAKNVATNLLNNLYKTEQINAKLSLSYFLENGDFISFNIAEDFLYVDKDREYRINNMETNLKEMNTTIDVVERIIIEKIDNL